MSTAAPQHAVNPLKFYMELGVGGIDPIQHLTQLEGKGVRFDLNAREAQCHRSNKPGPKRFITLGCCEVRDFGFTKPPTTTELVAVAEKFGTLCPSETATHLGEALILRDEEACVSLLMKPIPDRHDAPQMFTVRRTSDGKCRINGRYAHPKHRWLPHYRVVMVIPG